MPDTRIPAVETAPAAAPLSGITQIGRGIPRTYPNGHPLTQEGVVAELIDAFAVGVEQPAELAVRHRVTRAAIYAFRNRHAEQIDARRAELGEAFATETGLWIASKEARMGELQTAAERVLGLLQADDLDPSMVPEFSRTLVTILHEAAEQLGQLPTRVQVQQTTVVQYDIVGVDVDRL